MDLREALPGMSWRRFLALVQGFGPNTATVAHLSAKNRPKGGTGKHRPTPDVVIDFDRNPEGADDFFAAMASNGRNRSKETA